MLKGLLVGIFVVAGIGLLFIFPGDTMSSNEMRDYTLRKTYLAKNTEHYARCYNSVNYGVSGLTDIEISLMDEHFNDSRVTSRKMKLVEESFMDNIKQRCSKIIDEYESEYKKADEIQKESQSLSMGWRTFVFGGGSQAIPADEILEYSPPRARMAVAFNDYVFTADEAKEYYKEKLGL